MKLVRITQSAVSHLDEYKPDLDDNIAAAAPDWAAIRPEVYVVIFSLDVIHDHDNPACRPSSIEFTTRIPVITAPEDHSSIVARAKLQMKSDLVALSDQIGDAHG